MTPFAEDAHYIKKKINLSMTDHTGEISEYEVAMNNILAYLEKAHSRSSRSRKAS